MQSMNQLLAKHVGSSPQTSLLGVDDNCMQTVYDESHWVAADCYDGEVFVTNSLGDTISPDVAKQLKQLFADNVNGSLAVNNIYCTQQPNRSNCGIFTFSSGRRQTSHHGGFECTVRHAENATAPVSVPRKAESLIVS